MRPLLTVLIFLLTTINASAASLDDLLLVTEEYPPLNFSEEDTRRGIATDFLVAILTAGGSEQRHKDIASISWARGYQLARSRPNVLLYSMTRSEQREALFHWIGPILNSDIVLLARKADRIVINDPQQLKGGKFKIGVVLDDIGHQLLKELQVDSRSIYPSNRGSYLLKTLAENRVDLIAYDSLVSHWNLIQLGYDPADFEAVYELKKAAYYFTVSLRTAPQLVTPLQNQFDRLKQSGRLDQIIKGYLQHE